MGVWLFEFCKLGINSGGGWCSVIWCSNLFSLMSSGFLPSHNTIKNHATDSKFIILFEYLFWKKRIVSLIQPLASEMSIFQSWSSSHDRRWWWKCGWGCKSRALFVLNKLFFHHNRESSAHIITYPFPAPFYEQDTDVLELRSIIQTAVHIFQIDNHGLRLQGADSWLN